MADWSESFVRDYRKSKSKITKYRASLLRIDPDKLTDRQIEEIAMLNDIVNSMVFAIEWMRTGHQPGVYRGIDRRGVYREPHVLDKDMFPSLQESLPKTFYLTPEQRSEALATISTMSQREFDCFLLHAVEGKSYAEIAVQLKLSKASVQRYVNRAKSKVPSAQSG